MNLHQLFETLFELFGQEGDGAARIEISGGTVSVELSNDHAIAGHTSDPTNYVARLEQSIDAFKAAQ